MADDVPVDDAQDQVVTVQQIADAVTASIAKTFKGDDAADTAAQAFTKAVLLIAKTIAVVLAPLAKVGGKALVELEEPILPIFAAFVEPIVGNLFGTEVAAGSFDSRSNRDGRENAARSIVDAYSAALVGDAAGPQEPGDDGAKRIATAAVHAALEGWFNELIPEILGEMVPIDWMHFEAFTGLSEEIIGALGIGRLVRRAFAPLVDAVAAEPMKWKVNKTFTPTLLGPSTALRQFTRGRWDWADVEEELARAGYSPERIDALLAEQTKYLSVDDLASLLWLELIEQGEALQTMRDQGYDDQTASKHLNLRKITKEDGIRHELATAAVSAYVDRRLDDGALADILDASVTATHERELLTNTARGRRALNTKVLSPAQAESCVKAGILAVSDYRAALVQDGYTDDAALALELLLRKELDAKQSLEEARAQALADRAAALAAKTAAADAKRQAIAAALALKRRGSLSELEHATVIGLIPISRLEEVLNADFDGDTVAIYVADVEQQHAAYVAQQQQRADAAKRAAAKGLNVGQLEAAVYAGVLTVDEFRARVRGSGLQATDVDVLAATVAAKLADLTAAKKRQADAAAVAKSKGIDLGRFEQLVLRGLRTLDAYDAQLQALGFDDAARAGMRELLQSKIDEKAAAAALRDATGKGNPARGLSLEQFRKAVIAGTKTIDEFQTYLVANKYTTDAQAVLVDELRSDVDAAAAAQQRRAEADAAVGRQGLSVKAAARAARLGIITPDAYRAALEQAGYSDDDVGLELDLLVAEMATTKAAQKVQRGTATPASTHGLTLSAIAGAVKAGAATIADYQSAAAAAGLDDDAIATLVAQLDDELAAVADAKGRRQQLVPALLAQGIDLADLETSVRQGTLTVAAFEDRLTTLGYPAADAQLVGSLLETELANGG